MIRHILSLITLLSCLLVFPQREVKQEVYFETDKYNIPSTEESRLLLFISKLSDINIESISIYGFCDDVGAPDYNLKLSQQRANAIKAVFADNEISETLISNVDGKGQILLRIIEEKDVVKIRGLNRKVEIIVKEKAPVIIKETPIVEKNNATYGILICGSANGVAITANKHQKIRAGLAWNKEVVQLIRGHNNANILCIPARFTAIAQAIEMVETFLNTEFEGGRHQTRIDKIPLSC